MSDKNIFEFSENNLSKEEITALKLLQNNESLTKLLSSGEAYKLIGFIADNAPTILSNHVGSKYNEYLEEEKLDSVNIAFANKSKQSIDIISSMAAFTRRKEYVSSLAPRYNSLLSKEADKSDKPTIKRPRPDILKFEIEGTEFTLNGGGQVKEEVVEFFYKKVSTCKNYDSMYKKLLSEVSEYKLPAATDAKLENFANVIISTKTIRFKSGNEESPCRQRIPSKLTVSIANELKKKDVKLEDFYIENDFDKVFPKAKESATTALIKEIKKLNIPEIADKL